MSDNDTTITVTRGSREERSQKKQSSSTTRSRSSDLGLPGPGALVSGVVSGVRTAWWVGLGAFAVARKAGAQVFDALVEEGKSWEQARRERTEATARQVRTMTEENDALRTTEERVREEVNEALQRIGVPSRNDVDALREHVDSLADRIDALRAEIEASGTEEEN